MRWPPFLRRRDALDLSPRAKVVAYASLLAWTVVVLLPLYWLVVTSFKLPIQVNSGPVYLPFVDFEPTLDNWRFILIDSPERHGAAVRELRRSWRS